VTGARDEHMNVPTWRMRQLQDVEHEARQIVELISTTSPHERTRLADLAIEARDRLAEALGDD
jgi:hypothetical protein